MQNLNAKKWKEFSLSELFDISATSSGIDKCKLINRNGNIPYVTRTDKSNGYDSFIGRQDNKYRTNKKNTITIGLDTQTVYYQPENFYTGQNIQILSNSYLNRYNALFIIPLIKILMEKFNWGGNGATLTRLRRGKILIPLNDKNNPDWQFMEDFMRNKEKELKDKYKKLISNRIKNLENFVKEDKEWKEFYLKDIFSEVQRGKRLTKSVHIKGLIPYVSSSSCNNGVDDYISNTNNVRIYENCLTLANSGSVGSSFYQQFKFVASDHITALKNNKFNKYVYMFIATITKRFSEKYSFNREINDKRIKREIILLPINKNGKPDYEYMENYMKYLEQQKLLKYIH